MPELPEVETIKNMLRNGGEDSPSLLGCRITAVELLWEKTVAEPSPGEFKDRLVGQTIREFGRRGKYLLVHLSNDTLAVHLRMSGDLRVEPAQAEVPPHHRLILILDKDLRLAFNHTRKFGRVWLTQDCESLLEHLGPEPLDPDFTPEIFYQRLNGRRRQLKPLLLDQGFLSGMGNIYTDEALHLAGLHPQTVSNTLTFEQAQCLWERIRQVLQDGIRRQGASIDWVYRGGGFQEDFQVYQRTGQPCYRCGSEVERILVGQRGTHFCPHCQPGA